MVKDVDSASWDERLVLIDYEFSGYRQRGADIGNYFAMHMFDFGAERLMTKKPYPDENTRRHFIRAYLDQCKTIPEFADWDFDGKDSEEQILMEAEFYNLGESCSPLGRLT